MQGNKCHWFPVSVVRGKKENNLNESDNLLDLCSCIWVLFNRRLKNVLVHILWESGFWWHILLLSLGVSMQPAVRSM